MNNQNGDRRQSGGQPGNKNGKIPKPKTAHLHMRCKGSDKGAWTKAANSAVKRGALLPDPRGNLASWAVMILNHAAARELEIREQRKSSVAAR